MTKLEPYGINSDDFMRASNISSTLANLWLSKIDFDLKEEILLPALLQETGKFILADLILSEKISDLFKSKISAGNSVKDVEMELLGVTTSQITAQIFRHWKLSDNLINMIEYVDDISKASPEYVKKSQILDVIKTACNVNNPLSEENVSIAIKKATAYGFDAKILKTAIETLQDRLLNEEA